MKADFQQRGGWWVIGQSVLMLAVLILGPWFRDDWNSGIALVFGLTLLTLSALAGLSGVRDLGINRTPFPVPNANSQLITQGIYARVRHPLYVSVMAFHFAWALLWESFPALIAAMVSIVFFDLKARHEERLLRAKFPDYDAYTHRVRRFVPGVY